MANDKPLMLTSPKQRQGSYFEQQACEFLQERGLILVAQNWQQPKVGELDLVMLEKGQAWSTLVFVEVRQRQQSHQTGIHIYDIEGFAVKNDALL